MTCTTGQSGKITGFWVINVPNGYIYQHKNLLAAKSRHFHFERQNGTCKGTLCAFDTSKTVGVGSHILPLEDWLVIPYHNRHMHCPRLSPYVMSDLEMVYIQHGTVRDSHI